MPLLNVESGGQLPLLKRPVVGKTWVQSIKEFYTQYLLFGNLFICSEYGTGLNARRVTSLYHLPAQAVQIYLARDFRRIDYYAVNLNYSNFDNNKIPADQVAHIKNPNPDFESSTNTLYGQSPFAAVLKPIQTVNESIQMGIWALQNKGAAKMVGPKYEGMEISDLQQQNLRENIRQVAQGTKNVGSIPIASVALDTVDLSASVKDILMLDQRAKAEAEICNSIGIPVQLIGQNIKSMYDQKEAKVEMWESCIMPFLDELKEALNNSLIKSYGENITLKYNVDHIPALQEKRLLLGKGIKEMAGFITVNEARKMVGLKPIEGGDKLLQAGQPTTRTPNMNRPDGYDDEYNETQRGITNLY